MKKIKTLTIIIAFVLSACSDNIEAVLPDNLVSQEKLSYEKFLSKYAINASDNSMEFFKSNGTEKLRLSMELVNFDNNTSYSETNPLPRNYLLNMTNLVQSEIPLLPDIEALDIASIKTVNMDFPNLTAAQIANYRDHLTKYYERKLEYIAFKKISIDPNDPLGKNLPGELKSSNVGPLCSAELAYLALHPLKVPAISFATLSTIQTIDSWFGEEAYYGDVSGFDNTPINAVQHALWNYNIAQRVSSLGWPIGSNSIGLNVAENFTYAHEQCAGTERTFRNAMDLHNNKIGRHLFTRFPGISGNTLKNTFLDEMFDGWCADTTIPAIEASPINNLVYTHFIDANGDRIKCSLNPMPIAIAGPRSILPDYHSWTSTVSGAEGVVPPSRGNSGAPIKYYWYWNGSLVSQANNLLITVTDNMFDSFGNATILLDVRSSMHQRSITTYTVRKNTGTPRGGGDDNSPRGDIN